MQRRRWTAEEDDVLLRTASGNYNTPEVFRRVSEQIQCTAVQAKNRYNYLRRVMIQRGVDAGPIPVHRRSSNWTAEEKDDCLCALLDMGYKPHLIAQAVPTRTPAQIARFIQDTLRRTRPELADAIPHSKRRRYFGRRPRRRTEDSETGPGSEAERAEELEGQRAAHEEGEDNVSEFEAHVGVDIFGVPPKPLDKVQAQGREQRQ